VKFFRDRENEFPIFSKKEDIENISKSVFYAEELKKNQALFKGLIDFLL